MTVLAGTSGFSYKEWKGAFYPSDLKNADMLSYYATRLPAVEINNTFYRLPQSSVLESWRESVPAGFMFALKASRRITHFKRLKDCDDVTGFLIEGARKLEDRLGAILFQLPPHFGKDLERLKRFLELLPEDLRFTFEFRHAGWYEEDVFETLAAKNVALCTADSENGPAEIVPTANWGYLRMRRPGYRKSELDDWAKRIGNQQWDTAFVMFKHEDEASGPKLAEDFLERFTD